MYVLVRLSIFFESWCVLHTPEALTEIFAFYDMRRTYAGKSGRRTNKQVQTIYPSPSLCRREHDSRNRLMHKT